MAFNESLEAKVKERTQELEEANYELEAFSYTVSHDLQSPLRSLSGFSKLLLRDCSNTLDTTANGYLDIINTNANRMSTLINKLLAFAKLGKAPLMKKKINMRELVDIVIDELKFSTHSLNAEIEVGSMPFILCDPALIRLVWSNLIGNAVKYSSKKAQPVITIGTEKREDGIVFYIKDNGDGFDMQHADRLFGVFQRMHHTNEFEGTGVGLATVQRIITKHGGRVWAQAQKNEEATFYFTLS